MYPRLLSIFAYSFLAVLLCSCILDKDKEPDPPDTFVSGFIQMEDVAGPTAGAYIIGKFQILPSKKAVVDWGGVRNLYRNSSRGMFCDYEIENKRRDFRTTASQYISVGDLSYRHEYQTEDASIPKDKKNIYFAAAPEDFLLGKYLLQATGSDHVAGFGAPLSAPEALKDVKVNSVGIEKDNIKIEKSKALKLQWRAGQYPNENNIMGVKIITETSSQKVGLKCLVLEKDLVKKANMVRWDIPAAELSKLITGGQSEIDVFRAHLIIAKGNGLEVELQSLRTWYAEALIEE